MIHINLMKPKIRFVAAFEGNELMDRAKPIMAFVCQDDGSIQTKIMVESWALVKGASVIRNCKFFDLPESRGILCELSAPPPRPHGSFHAEIKGNDIKITTEKESRP